MKIQGKVGDIHVAVEGLSSFRVLTDDPAKPIILNAPASAIGQLVSLSGKVVTIEVLEVEEPS